MKSFLDKFTVDDVLLKPEPGTPMLPPQHPKLRPKTPTIKDIPKNLLPETKIFKEQSPKEVKSQQDFTKIEEQPQTIVLVADKTVKIEPEPIKLESKEVIQEPKVKNFKLSDHNTKKKSSKESKSIKSEYKKRKSVDVDVISTTSSDEYEEDEEEKKKTLENMNALALQHKSERDYVEYHKLYLTFVRLFEECDKEDKEKKKSQKKTQKILNYEE